MSTKQLQKPANIASKILIAPYADPTAWSIIFSNLLIIALAVKQDWSLGQMLWIYWAQSVIIGFFTAFKMLAFGGIPENIGLKINSAAGKIVEVTVSVAGRIFLTGFYIFHYGAFHLVYAMFLSAIFGTFERINIFGDITPVLDLHPVIYASAIFFLSHLFSLIFNWNSFKGKDPSEFMMGSYVRIIPMHLTIIFGTMLLSFGLPKATLILFMLLKTGADVVMHNREHKPAQ